MSNAAMHEKWNEKCHLVRKAQGRYNQDPSPTNYSKLQNALYEKGLFEEVAGPNALVTHTGQGHNCAWTLCGC